ncbi:MAG: CDP-alcohol phosphatidyltransferase family protein [Nanoarchaeota archaeon]|nr:CDP-alcohol phosphatidyltransferase family protein [Nanoarchaeota archaeon]
MNLLKRVKKLFHKAVEPLIKVLVRLKITPNMVSTSSLFFLAVTVYFIINKNTIAAGLMLAITSIVDALDGAVAKKVGSTRFGDFYDAFLDRIVEGIVYVVIAYTYPSIYLICFIAFGLSYMTSYVAARAEVWTIGVKIKYLGIGGRPGRLLVLILSFMLDKIELGLYIISFFALITVIGRSIVTLRILSKKN